MPNYLEGQEGHPMVSKIAAVLPHCKATNTCCTMKVHDCALSDSSDSDSNVCQKVKGISANSFGCLHNYCNKVVCLA